MRKIALLILSVYLSLLLTPMAFAENENTAQKIETEYGANSLCNLKAGENTMPALNLSEAIEKIEQDEAAEAAASTDEDKSSTKPAISRSKKIQDKKNSFRVELSEFLAAAVEKSTCGEAKDGFYEKGACKDQVITEVTEAFAPEVESVNGQIVNLYSGLCCLIYEKNGDEPKATYTCLDSRTIYTNTFEKCNENAILCEKRQWLIGKSGAGIIKLYVKQIYSWGAGTAGFIAVIVIIISGVQIQLSGVSGDLSQAKDRILQSLSGLVLIFLSGIILYTINPGFFS